MIFVWALLLLYPFEIQAKTYAKDGDSLVIDKLEIRLGGIDAPEYSQLCHDEKKEYKCGIKAHKFLKKIIKGRKVVCNKITIDIYKRQVSECFADSININKKMLESGWAVAYKTNNNDYKIAEKSAKEKKLGIWQGKFMKPELYRVLNR